MSIPVFPYTPAALTSASQRGAIVGALSRPGISRLPPSHEIDLFDFENGAGGGDPDQGLLALGSDIYGSANGGSNNAGLIFKLARRGGDYRETVIYSFSGGGDGSGPNSQLVADQNGALYGTTSDAGQSGVGTVFKLVPNGSGFTETTLDAFDQNQHDGRVANGVIVDGNGALYGTTQSGGSAGDGIVFKLTPTGSTYAESILYNFVGGADGANPRAGLVEDVSGALYGTTYTGGRYGAGTIFKLSPSASGYTESVVYAFQGTYDGSNPAAPLVMDARGRFYGTTVFGGGPSYSGSVFELRPTRGGYRERVLYGFQGGFDGDWPNSAVTLGRNGNIYGTTVLGGGPQNDGTIFQLTPTAMGGYAETIPHQFVGAPSDGQWPLTGMVASKGGLFGLTEIGGLCCGTFFEFNP